MDALLTTCPYVNVNGTCAVSSPLEQLESTPRSRHCHHVQGHFCNDYSKYYHRVQLEVEQFREAVSDQPPVV